MSGLSVPSALGKFHSSGWPNQWGRSPTRDRGIGFVSRDYALLPKDGTLAVYMGVGRVEAIAGELAGAGFPPDTPFAVVENGNRPEQRILRGTLSDLPRIAAESGVRSPAILFVGRSAAALPFKNTGETSDERVAQGV